jgi:hypothetical protein
MSDTTWAERALALWLLAAGLLCASAVVPVAMPLSWHAATHAWLGLGEFPEQPIAEYLARGMSGMCMFYGLLLIYFSRDVRKYRGIITFQVIALMLILVGATLAFWNSGLPRWWVLGDVFAVWIFGLVVLFLQRCAPTVRQ